MRVIGEEFPDGLESDDPEASEQFRRGYEEWQANTELRQPDQAIHTTWLRLVLRELLGYHSQVLVEGASLPEGVKATLPEHHVSLRPDAGVKDPADGQLVLLVTLLPAGASVDRPTSERGLHASHAERMRLLLRGTGVRSGLVTNGEQWTLVHQPPDRTATFVTWESEVLAEEINARRSFRSLLGVRRLVGVSRDQTLDGLFERSKDDEREVTDQLGAQTRRAVELLIEAIGEADRQTGNALIGSETLDRVYEGAVATVMRIVFLLAAEARGLLPDETGWVEAYAATPLRELLRAEADRGGEELLDRRFDAWPRLLAAFRAVHGGIQHDRLRLPAYGGGLFDPDRYRFLEGVASRPLRISNRILLHILDALQTLEVDVPGGRERRPLSFRALGVEQIGHVYEGLLDHEAVRATDPWVGLAGTGGKEPELNLVDLEALADRGQSELVAALKKETGRSPSALNRALASEPDPGHLERVRAACNHDEKLVERVRPFLGLIRDNAFGSPVVYPPDALFVTASTRRRATGTHYTPPSLTEPIVRYALEPLVYEGPAEGRRREDWRLRPPTELLGLKICDLAMGSAAFLVAACRYLAARLVEAWDQHPDEMQADVGANAEERELNARRLIVERCLYGVDKNPLAVEIAKVSLWLVTLRSDRPFTFLDHALRQGDSLLGVIDERQLRGLALNREAAQQLGSSEALHAIHEALQRVGALRGRIEASEAIDIRGTQQKAAWLEQAQRETATLRVIADLISSAALAAASSRDRVTASHLIEPYATDVVLALTAEDESERLRAQVRLAERATRFFETATVAGDPERANPFHWTIEFPEVFQDKRGGFDAILGNPPFLGGKKLSGELGAPYREFLVEEIADGRRGNADLVAFFFLRAASLIRSGGMFGLVATNTVGQGDTREVGLDALAEGGYTFARAVDTVAWPGEAVLYVSYLWGHNGDWKGEFVLDGTQVQGITSSLDPKSRVSGTAFRLAANHRLAHQGSIILGDSFFLDSDEAAALLRRNPVNRAVIKPCLNAADLNELPDQTATRWTVDFTGMDEEQASQFEEPWAIALERVLPDRQSRDPNVYKGLLARWWQYWNPREDLYKAAAALSRVLVGPRTSKWWSVSPMATDWVYSDATVVFLFDSDAHAAVLSSAFHDAWARKYSGSLKFDLRYSPTDCFENFPFPNAMELLEEVGERYISHRKETMLNASHGLTKVYNRLHEQPDDRDRAILELRRLQRELDRAVADAYGWNDLELDHEFRDTPLGLRYTISEPVRSESLDRLLELNQARNVDEVKQGLHDRKPGRNARTKAATPATSRGTVTLFSHE
jgi:hypothetical protein